MATAVSQKQRLPIAEIFGPTIQGEGMLIGRQTMFVRLAGCDSRCAWCDTKDAVLPEYTRLATRMGVDDIMRSLALLAGDAPPPVVTLSGGNPCLFDCGPLVGELKAAEYLVAVETQGTVAPEWLKRCDCVTVSPKPPSAQTDPASPPTVVECLLYGKQHGGHACLKFACADFRDVRWAKAYADDVQAIIGDTWRVPVYVQPVNPAPLHATPANPLAHGHTDVGMLLTLTRHLASQVLRMPWPEAVVLPQLHALLWPNEKGV